MATHPGDEPTPERFVAELRSHSQSDRETFAVLQQELRRIARAKMRFERSDHTLQPTALVNEVFLKLFKHGVPDNFWSDPARAIRFIARAMGQILTDHADAYQAGKRGGPDKARVPMDEQARESALLVSPQQSEDVLAVRDALELLCNTSPRQAQVVELLFYGGLTQEEIAAALELSVETVKLDWRKAKAFLKVNLSPARATPQ
jgi:RNA polymerase sigma factor (TIGR02999 family)